MKEKITGVDYLKIALFAIAGICLELLLVLVEPFFYGQDVSFENWTIMSHWFFTYVLWGIAVFLILRYAVQRYGFKLREIAVSPKIWQYIFVVLLLAIAVFLSFKSWGGFKPYIEFQKLGAVKFIMQYTYYFIETALFTIIIVFGQKAFEKWFKNDKIPYGGILCAFTWGLGHIFTKSSVEVGIASAILGFGFGAVYLLLNRDIIKTTPILFLMFIL